MHIILLLLFTGCINFNDVEVGEIKSVRFNSMRDNTVEFTIRVPLSNPGKLGFKIREINLRTSVNNYYLGRLESNDLVIIPAKSSEVHDINLRLRISNIIQGVSVFLTLLKEDNIKVDVEGYIKFSSGLISRKVDIKETTFINSFK